MQTENKELFLSSFFLSLYIFLISPLTIVIENYSEFSFGFIEIFTSALPFFFVAFLLLMAIAFLVGRNARRVYLFLIVIVLTLSVINSQILFGNYGAFDGRGLDISIYSVVSFLQIILAIVVIIGVIFQKIREGFIFLSTALLTINFILSITSFSFGGEPYFKEPSEPSKDFVNLSRDKVNYLYIILDEVYGGSAKRIFHDNNDLGKKFTGFTNFTNVGGVFPSTIMAIPAILTGQVYQEGMDIDVFDNKSFKLSPLLKSLETNGIDSKFHTVSKYCHYLPDENCSPIRSMVGRKINVLNEYIQLLDLSLFKSVPEVLKNQVYRDGSWLVREINIGSKTGKAELYIKEFDYIVKNLKASNNLSTFRLFHTVLTHSPIKYNKHCELLKKKLKDNFENYLQQDTCGFIQISRIIDKLKELSVYDNTYIIISSDHGRPQIPAEIAKQFSLSDAGVSSTEYGYSHAMLMVKPPNAKGKLKSSHLPMSLMDIGSLVVNSIAGDSDKFNLLHERKYYHYNWSNNWRDKILPPFDSVYFIGDDITIPSNWALDVKYMKDHLEKRPFSILKCEEKVLFSKRKKNRDGSQGKKNIYYSRGLSKVEMWGRWSNKKGVSVFFKPEDKECGFEKLSMTIRGFIRQQHPSQHSEVILNETKIGDIVIKLGEQNPRDFTFDIPSKLLKPGEINVLEFHIENPVSPKSLGVSDGIRLLGLGFYSMVFQ